MKITDEELVRWLRSEIDRRRAEAKALENQADALMEVLQRVAS